MFGSSTYANAPPPSRDICGLFSENLPKGGAVLFGWERTYISSLQEQWHMGSLKPPLEKFGRSRNCRFSYYNKIELEFRSEVPTPAKSTYRLAYMYILVNSLEYMGF